MGNSLNGLDVEAFNETCELIKKDPSLAKAQFRLHNTWKNGGQNHVKIEGFMLPGKSKLGKSHLNLLLMSHRCC